MRALAALAVLVVGLSGSRQAEAQIPVGRGATTTIGFTGFGGTGFGTTGGIGQLNSTSWIPVGEGSGTGFGGSCGTSPIMPCSRGPVSAGALLALEAGVYAVARPVAGGVALGLASGAPGFFRPGGVRLRLVNADTVPLTALQITIDWAARMIPARMRDALVLGAVDCAGGPSTRISPTSGGSSGTAGAWTARSDMYDVSGLTVAGSGFTCFELLVGTGPGVLGLDLVAVEQITITVPAVCGDGMVDLGEQCDGGICCDSMCHFATATDCDDMDGNPCTTGMCSGGECMATHALEGAFVDACEDMDPCTFRGCSGGACTDLSGCDPSDRCLVCNNTARTCDAVPLCCHGDRDCAGMECATGTCLDTSRCELDPSCDAGPTSDAAQDDAAAGDASTRRDGSVLDADTRIDAGSTAFDAGAATTSARFGGGGGCRCSAAGRGPGGSGAFAVGIALALLLQRRRRTRARQVSG